MQEKAGIRKEIMKRKMIFTGALSIMIALMLWSCSSTKLATAGVPSCILQKIDTLKTLPRSNPPLKVEEYVYNGKRSYLVTSPCCDQYNLLYNDSCEVICAPSGGYTGAGDGACKDFSANAVFVRTVWEQK